MEEKVKAPFWKPALIYGAIVGLVSILLAIVFYVLNFQFKTWAMIVSLIVSIVVVAYCLKAYRDEHLGGFATYGKLLLMTLAIAVVSSLLSTAYTYVLVNYIDVEYVEKVKQFTIEKISENPRVTEAQLDMLIERTENKTTKAKIIRQPLVGGLIFTFIIGLIAAAFLKREENPVSNAM